MIYKSSIKPLIDLITALLLIIITLPLIIISIICLMVGNKGKVFFWQNRPGKNQKIFKLLKLRTMKDVYGRDGRLLPDENRITRIGNIIRKLSIDELPQLINVIKGDMSLIGPRPLLIEYLPLYNEYQKRRHEVKPGITGWAQVNGRNAISWEQKFDLDVWYVDNISFLLDMKIVFMTIVKIINRESTNQPGHATMERFYGTK